jgi:hypothetical protein
MHDLGADGLKVMFHLKIIEFGILRKNVFQQFSEPGDVPLPIAQIIDQHPSVSSGLDIERPIK